MKKILILLLLLAVSVSGTTVYKFIATGGTGLDSVRTILYDYDTRKDSLLANHISSDALILDSFSIQDTSNFQIIQYWYWDEDPNPITHVESFEFDKFKRLKDGAIGTATITLNAYDSIANSVLEDSLSYQGSPSKWDADDSTKFKGLVDDTLKKAHTDTDWGAGGSGGNSVTLYVVDTVKGSGGTPDTVAGATVIIKTMTSSPHAGILTTNSNGFVNFNAPSDSFLVVVEKFTYVFPLDTIVVSGDDTFATTGYQNNPTITAPSNSNLSNVWGQIYDASYIQVQYAKAIFEIDEIVDTCGNVNIPKTEYEALANDTGYFEKELLKTACMPGNKKWSVRYEYKDLNGKLWISKTHSFPIPADSTTYKLVF